MGTDLSTDLDALRITHLVRPRVASSRFAAEEAKSVCRTVDRALNLALVLAGAVGLEPTTLGLEDRCSIH